ncbi:hypothetical protein [Archangium sp.]|uniref:hypothetical protein n=1 Tax=Archangium sp. TaxID=1872627 RepID=UPI00286CE64C|nr:hypothetical protein [Archangium sp.]
MEWWATIAIGLVAVWIARSRMGTIAAAMFWPWWRSKEGFQGVAWGSPFMTVAERFVGLRLSNQGQVAWTTAIHEGVSVDLGFGFTKAGRLRNTTVSRTLPSPGAAAAEFLRRATALSAKFGPTPSSERHQSIEAVVLAIETNPTELHCFWWPNGGDTTVSLFVDTSGPGVVVGTLFNCILLADPETLDARRAA